jgi:hypothetical protein
MTGWPDTTWLGRARRLKMDATLPEILAFAN